MRQTHVTVGKEARGMDGGAVRSGEWYESGCGHWVDGIAFGGCPQTYAGHTHTVRHCVRADIVQCTSSFIHIYHVIYMHVDGTSTVHSRHTCE